MWLGLYADAFGFESLFMHCWRLRETILDILEKTTGGRVIFSVCKIGGVRKDIENEDLRQIVLMLNKMRKETEEVTNVFIKDKSVENRTKDVGILTKENAVKFGAVGPVARGSGVVQDMRLIGYGAYSDLAFEPVIETAGDCHARACIRIRELFQSMDLIGEAVEKIPGGEIAVPVKGDVPAGDFVMRVEQPRGEAYYYSKGADSKFLQRMRVRTPTNQNIPSLVKMLQGCELSDVPTLVLTIDPCISCTER
jgi:ech hydrogenase subunit E